MNKLLIDIVKKKVSDYYADTANHYKHLHQYPELSFEEKNTAAYVECELKKFNIEFRKNIGGYGILAWIKGHQASSKVIALRADMDALPITEQNDIGFKSKNDGVMHACGHDTHTASLLTVARIVSEMKDHFAGTILFVFQPGEEKHPGGARLMLEDGIFDVHKPDIIVGQHAYVDYPVGTVGFEEGVVMASADEVHIRIKGKGGHGAIPHELNDTVLAASQVLVSMQQIVSRISNPFKPCVLSFGKFIADGATNIIPNVVTLAGSLRCMDEEERSKIKSTIPNIAHYTAKAYGCECEIEVYDGYPCVYNDAKTTQTAKSFASEYLGEDKVKGLPKRMTAEDFGFFSQLYPSTFYRYGVKGEGEISGLHTPTFLIEEEALRTSVGAMAYLALRYCSQG
ncbi:MAG: hypothetical protein RL662_163 [Bacteroidota bacterium]|jgi:hippurate hydrolase